MELFWQEKKQQPYSNKTKPKKHTQRCSLKQFLQLSLCCNSDYVLRRGKTITVQEWFCISFLWRLYNLPFFPTGLKWVLSYTEIINVEPSWYSQTACLVPETAFLYLSLCCQQWGQWLNREETCMLVCFSKDL